MDNIFRYTEKDMIKDPLQMLYDIDLMLKGQQPTELLGIVYFQNMKHFDIYKEKLKDNIIVYHLKLKQEKFYGIYPLLKKILRQWIVVYGKKKDLKKFKILQKSKEHIYQNKIEYFQDIGIDFKKFKEDCEYQKNLYRAHNQFLNFYLNKNFKIEKSFKYYFLADTCYSKFLRLLPKLINQDSSNKKEKQNVLLVQAEQKSLKYFIASFCTDLQRWVISDQEKIYMSIYVFAQEKIKNYRLSILKQFDEHFLKNLYLKKFCQQKNLSVVFHVEQDKIIFETFIYNDQTISQFPPFFVEKVFLLFQLPFKKLETHVITCRERLNNFVNKQYYIYDQSMNLESEKKLVFNIILDDKRLFEVPDDRQIFYQCYFDQTFDMQKSIDFSIDLYNIQQIDEQQSKIDEINKLNIDQIKKRKLKFFYYFLIQNKFNKEEIIKYRKQFFLFDKVYKFKEMEQKIHDQYITLYKKIDTVIELKNPSNFFSYKGEVCQQKLIKIVFLSQAPYQINEDFKLNLVKFYTQKGFIVYRIQDIIQNQNIQRFFQQQDYNKKRKAFQKIDILELIQQLDKEIRYIYRKKFCLFLDVFQAPNETMIFLQNVKKFLQYQGFSTNFQIIVPKNEFQIQNLQFGKQIINYPFSMEKIFYLFKMITQKEKLNYLQAIDIFSKIFLEYLFDVEYDIRDQQEFPVLSCCFYQHKNETQKNEVQKYLLLPFLQTLLMYHSLQSEIKNLKYLKQYQIQKQKLAQTFVDIEKNNICFQFSDCRNMNFTKLNYDLLNTNRLDKQIKFKQNIIYYAVFFNKNIEIKFKLQLDYINSKIKYIIDQYKQDIQDFVTLQNYQGNEHRKFDRHQHMTVCYLGNKDPNKEQQKIIDCYIVAKMYSFYTKYMVFIKDKIGFFMLEQSELPSCNKFEHSTIYYCNSYTAVNSNDMAERVNQQIQLKNEIYTCEEQQLNIYRVKDLFDDVEVEAYVWQTRIKLDGIFNFVLGNF